MWLRKPGHTAGDNSKEPPQYPGLMQSNPLHDMSSSSYPLSDRPTVTEDEVTTGRHVPALDRDIHVTPSLPIKKMSGTYAARHEEALPIMWNTDN